VFDDIAQMVRQQSRKSDVVAKTGAARLAVLAPDTDAAGARLLVARLQRELDAAARNAPTARGIRLRAGYCAVSDLAAAKLDLSELVDRAQSALAHLSTRGQVDSVVSFDELPTA
jgi:GGDEF domain-containing protein